MEFRYIVLQPGRRHDALMFRTRKAARSWITSYVARDKRKRFRIVTAYSN